MTPPRRHLIVAAGAALLLITAAVLPAFASESSDQRAGQQLLRSIDEGRSECADLSGADFEHIGEYVMGRMAGSTAAHEQMDELMRSMMGARSEERMHLFMGRRFTGCGGGTVPAGFGGMMGVMGVMGGGFRAADENGFGAMMGSVRTADSGDGWSDGAIATTVLMGVLLVLAVAALLFWRPWRAAPRNSGALQILDQRYARGELDAEDYERRRQALRR